MAGPRFAHVWASLLLPNGPDRAVQNYAPGAVSQSPWQPPASPLQNINWSSQEHRWGCPAVGEARGLGTVATKATSKLLMMGMFTIFIAVIVS